MKLDLILENASVITMDTKRPHATALGIFNGIIVAVDGDLDDVSARKRVDVGGATIIPGIIDAHCHTSWFGRTLVETDLSVPSSLAEVLVILRAMTSQTSKNCWVVAAGYNQHRFGGQYPSLRELDAIAPDQPLMIRQSSGHSVIVNSFALRLAGLIESEDPIGGVIERDASGYPTGRLEENAQDLVMDLLKPYPQDELVASIDRATRIYAAQGITSFTEAGIGKGWIGNSPSELRAYQDADSSGRLHARAQLMPTIDSLSPLESSLQSGLSLGLRSGLGGDMIRIGPTKVFIDGTLTGRTCALTQPFCGEPNNLGFLQSDEVDLREQMLAAAAAGWAIAAHAIGDRAIDVTLGILEEAQQRYGKPPIPHRIEHACYVRDDQIPRLARSGVAVTPQAMLVRQFGESFVEALGEERARGVYRARSLVEAGVLVAGSSDRPCVDGNPFEALRMLRERVTFGGTAYFPELESVSAETALGMYTRDSARATGDDSVGMLRPRLKADLAILSGSPLADDPEVLSNLSVLATLVGGKTTHGSI